MTRRSIPRLPCCVTCWNPARSATPPSSRIARARRAGRTRVGKSFRPEAVMARIALDAMGGDHAPQQTVLGAIDAVARGIDVVLVGDSDQLEAQLADVGAVLPVVHAPESIGMGEDPAAAVRAKKQSSVAVAARLVADGEADGMVSAGSTGAAMAAPAILIV